MKSIVKNMKTWDLLTWALLLLLVAQVVFMFFVNFTTLKYQVDFDSSGAYVHIQEVAKEHTLFPSTYRGATTLDVDSTVGLAAILYAITGNIFLAQGICNNLIIVLYLWVVASICDGLKLERRTKFFVMCLFMLPYSSGMLGYTSMMLSNVTPNTVRNFMPLLYFSILIDLYNNNWTRKTLVKSIASVVLMVITGVSAGFYVFAFGIASMILCDAFEVLRSGTLKSLISKRWVLHILMVIACLVGMAIQHKMGFVSKASEQNLITSSTIATHVEQWFVGIIELFGGIPYFDTPLLSRAGIIYVSKFVIAMLVIISVVFYAYRWVRNKEMKLPVKYALYVCGLDAVALILMNTTYGSSTYEYRYHIMPILFAIILLGCMAEDLLSNKNKLYKNMITLAFVFLIAGIELLGNNAYYDGIMTTAAEVAEYEEIDEILDETGVDLCIVYSDNWVSRGRLLRVFADDHGVLTMNTELNYSASVWGGSTRYLDADVYPGPIVLLAEESDYEVLEDGFKDDAELIGTVGTANLYLISENHFDFN